MKREKVRERDFGAEIARSLETRIDIDHAKKY